MAAVDPSPLLATDSNNEVTFTNPTTNDDFSDNSSPGGQQDNNSNGEANMNIQQKQLIESTRKLLLGMLQNIARTCHNEPKRTKTN